MTETQNTPETDDAESSYDYRIIPHERRYSVDADFARSLETRLNAALAEVAKSKKDVNDLNNLLRAAGWGQGEIDSAACVEEENEKLRAELRRLDQSKERQIVQDMDALLAELAQEKAKREEAEKERAAFMIAANNLQATCDHQQVTINALLARRNEMESALATLRAEVEKLRADNRRTLMNLLDIATGHAAQVPSIWRVEEALRAAIDAAKEAQ